MNIKYPTFPTNDAFMAGLFDACYRFHRGDGSVVLRCDHRGPLTMLQNWFPCRVNPHKKGFEAVVFGAPAGILMTIVLPLSKHDIGWPAAEPLDLEYVTLPGVTQHHDNDAYILGYFYAKVGKPTSETKVMKYPFPMDEHYTRVSVVPVAGKKSEEVAVCLNSAIMTLQRVLQHALPPTPDKLEYRSAICVRNRMCIVAAQQINAGRQRFRRASLTLEQCNIIDQHCISMGVKSICKMLGVTPGMVERYMKSVGKEPPPDPITSELIRCVEEGKDRDSIRFHIKHTFGIVMTADAVSAWKYRYKKKKEKKDNCLA